MKKREQDLIDALKSFYKDNTKLADKMVRQLYLSGDLSKEAWMEFKNGPGPKQVDDISRAKTVKPLLSPEYPKQKLSDPPEYDRCGNIMTAADLAAIKQRRKEEKERIESAKRIERDTRSRGLDRCGNQQSYC